MVLLLYIFFSPVRRGVVSMVSLLVDMFRLHDRSFFSHLIVSQHAANQLMLLMLFSIGDVLCCHDDDDDDDAADDGGGTCLCQFRFFSISQLHVRLVYVG